MKCVKLETLIVLVIVLAVSFAAGSANADMVALYKFESNTNDNSGNNRHGIEKGNPSYTAGVSGQAIMLDGKNSFVDCGTDAVFDIKCQITVACWIKVNKFDKNWQAIIARGDNSWRLQRAEDSNALEFACNGLAYAADPWIRGNINVNDGKWHHAAGVYDGAKMYLYIDGALDVSQEAIGTIDTNTAPVYIGDNAQGKGRNFNGLIDELVIFDNALNADEVRQLYSQGAASVTIATDAVWSQVRTAVSNIKLGKEPAAKAATEKLLGEFSGRKGVEGGLFQVAETYRNLKKYDKARQIYQYIADKYPESNCGAQSQLQVVVLNIQLEDKDNAAAEADIDKLLTKFRFGKNKGTDKIAKAFDQLISQYNEKLYKSVESADRQPDTSNQLEYYDRIIRKLCGYILANWPDSEYAMWAQRDIAFADIHKRDFAAAQAAINKLLANYPNHKGLTMALYWLGNDYRRIGESEKAMQLDKYNDAAAQATVNNLIVDFKNHPDLPAAVLAIAEAYYEKGMVIASSDQNAQKLYFEKSVNIIENDVIPNVLNKAVKASALYELGLNRDALGEYEKAAAAFKNAYQTDPKFQYADYCLFAQGYCYEELLEHQLVTETEAKPQIASHYSKLLADYPQSKYAPYASGWLQSNK